MAVRRVVNHVVKIRQLLLLHEIAQDIHVAIRFGVRREKNIVVGNDDNSLAVPDLGGFAKLAFEHADCSRPADIVRHQHIRVHPDIVTRGHPRLPRNARADIFFRQRHKSKNLRQNRRCINME